MNNDAREHELHNTHQGLSNNDTGHDVEWVLVSLLLEMYFKFCGWQISSRDQNGWVHNWLARARMIILITPTVLADRFTYSSILKL